MCSSVCVGVNFFFARRSTENEHVWYTHSSYSTLHHNPQTQDRDKIQLLHFTFRVVLLVLVNFWFTIRYSKNIRFVFVYVIMIYTVVKKYGGVWWLCAELCRAAVVGLGLFGLTCLQIWNQCFETRLGNDHTSCKIQCVALHAVQWVLCWRDL